MSGDQQYFATRPTVASSPRQFTMPLNGVPLEITTDSGVFSPTHLDTGTRVLLENTPKPPISGDLLDLGCGWGPIALSLALASPEAKIWAVDVNERALELTRTNAAANGLGNLVAVTGPEVPADVRFDAIYSNPPIRIGKAALHELLLRWLPRLKSDASAWLVVQKNLGSDSLARWLEDALEESHSISRHESKKGFRVLQVRANTQLQANAAPTHR